MFNTQEEKNEAIEAQKVVVDGATEQPAIEEAKAKLAEIEAEEVKEPAE